MKMIALFSFGLAITLLVGAPCHAAMRASAEATVIVTVVPTITVVSKTAVASAGVAVPTQTNDFHIDIAWSIGSNLDEVKFTLEASDLFKGDNPLDTSVTPIPLNIGRPAEIVLQSGSKVDGNNNEAAWKGRGNNIGNYPTQTTETVTCRSSDRGRFSQDVVTKIWYTQSQPDKPTGNYSGRVRLTTVATPASR